MSIFGKIPHNVFYGIYLISEFEPELIYCYELQQQKRKGKHKKNPC